MAYTEGHCSYCKNDSPQSAKMEAIPHVVALLHCADRAGYELKLSNGTRAYIAYDFFMTISRGRR